jgi:hypothetical protein
MMVRVQILTRIVALGPYLTRTRQKTDSETLISSTSIRRCVWGYKSKMCTTSGREWDKNINRDRGSYSDLGHGAQRAVAIPVEVLGILGDKARVGSCRAKRGDAIKSRFAESRGQGILSWPLARARQETKTRRKS